ncbi:MAG TPA: GNAT family N-acetyltransferase [Planctomycetota bacterium]|nr:GNAT family N-acetyltransferase [Planctomycetota bacterium]
MTEAWSVRPAGPQDEARQAEIFNVCFRKQKDARTFAWKYRENPDGPAISRVACDTQGAVVGGYSYVPRRFRRDGAPLVLMQASDAMTLPEWQGRGIFTGLDDLVCAEAGRQGVPWAFAYSGRISLKGFLRNGWQLIGHAPVWRLRFRSRRSVDRAGRAAPLLRPMTPLLDVMLGWSAQRRLPAGMATEVQRVARFDPDADELSDACVPARGLFGERHAPWLNWRYVDNPTRRQECYALRRQGRLDGWLVAEFVEGNAFLVDHLARDATARVLLLGGFAAAARERGMDEVTALLFEHHPAVPVLRALGFARRHSRPKAFRDMFPFIVRACRPDSPQEDLAIARWHLADGDRDAEHMSA